MSQHEKCLVMSIYLIKLPRHGSAGIWCLIALATSQCCRNQRLTRLHTSNFTLTIDGDSLSTTYEVNVKYGHSRGPVRCYRIELYTTEWRTDQLTDWMITDPSRADETIYKIEQSPSSNFEKRVYKLLPGGRYNVIATIRKQGWFGKWEVAWTNNDNFTTLSPSWFGYDCSFEHRGIKYTWGRYSKLTDANGNEVASITWNRLQGMLRVEEGEADLLEIILSTAMATKCHWGKYTNVNTGYTDLNRQYVPRPGDPGYERPIGQAHVQGGNGFAIQANWRPEL